jgi:hypothetical protein
MNGASTTIVPSAKSQIQRPRQTAPASAATLGPLRLGLLVSRATERERSTARKKAGKPPEFFLFAMKASKTFRVSDTKKAEKASHQKANRVLQLPILSHV